MRVYSYTRVSTGRQAEEGESLRAQQRRVEGYTQMNDMRVDRHFVERGVSGAVPLSERPEGSALLQLVRPGDVIITPKLDDASARPWMPWTFCRSSRSAASPST